MRHDRECRAVEAPTCLRRRFRIRSYSLSNQADVIDTMVPKQTAISRTSARATGSSTLRRLSSTSSHLFKNSEICQRVSYAEWINKPRMNFAATQASRTAMSKPSRSVQFCLQNSRSLPINQSIKSEPDQKTLVERSSDHCRVKQRR